MLHLTVPGTAAGDRLDRFLTAAAAALEPPLALSRVRVQALIREGRVRLNQHPAPKPGTALRAADVISLDDDSAALAPAVHDSAPPVAEDRALTILFEDADLLVLDKPPGLVVHPAPGNREGTLVNALVHHLGGAHALSGVGGPGRPGIVHRLDKDTSGCLVVAKNDAAHRALAAQFAGRTTDKRYLALVLGRPRADHGSIDAPIGRHPIHRKKMAVAPPPRRGRSARTDWRVVWEGRRMKDEGRRMKAEGQSSGGDAASGAPPSSFILLPSSFCLLECRLHTGRTHQIRVHLKHLGHPILGDALYGGPAVGAHAARQMLHAWKLGFRHPHSGDALEFRAPPPADFLEFIPDPTLISHESPLPNRA